MSTSSLENKVFWEPAKDISGVMIGRTLVDGDTVAELGNVHPDEEDSGEVVKDAPRVITTLARGTLLAIQGNERAMATKTRQTADGSNLNRAFLRERLWGENLPADPTYEDGRGLELMQFLEDLEAREGIAPLAGFIDLHQYEDPNGIPHIIAEEGSLEVARRIGPEIIVHGFAEAERGGTDDWGHKLGLRAAICYEIGAMDGGQASIDSLRRGHDAINRFLQAMGVKDGEMPPENANPLRIQVGPDSAYTRWGEVYESTRTRKSFERLQPNELIAVEDGKELRAAADRSQVIIFPKTNPEMGREAYVLGDIINE